MQNANSWGNATQMRSARKCNINATYVHFMKLPSRRREAAAGWDLPIICTYVAFMSHFRAECIFAAFPNYLHFAFLLYFNYFGKTGHANRIGHINNKGPCGRS